MSLSVFSSIPMQGFLYKCLGVVMRKSTHKQFVQSTLEVMFASIKHASQDEREVRMSEGGSPSIMIILSHIPHQKMNNLINYPVSE